LEVISESCATLPSCNPTSDDVEGSQDLVQELVSTNPAAAAAFCQYIHQKSQQEQGLPGLAGSCKESGALPSLLQALALAASILVKQATAGAIIKLQDWRLQPLRTPLANNTAAVHGYCPSQCCWAAADVLSGSRHAGLASAEPPSWLHPLLHLLRPDQVVALASQLLLYLAGVLEKKYVSKHQIVATHLQKQIVTTSSGFLAARMTSSSSFWDIQLLWVFSLIKICWAIHCKPLGRVLLVQGGVSAVTTRQSVPSWVEVLIVLIPMHMFCRRHISSIMSAML
jgi:hypothetical protein